MAGKGSKPHLKDAHHPKEGLRHATSPDPPSVSGSARPQPSNRLDPDFLPSMVGPSHGGPPPMMVEQKLASQHAEIQRLVGENQRLAVTHIALRQEIVAAQQEIVRLRQSRGGVDTEKEQRFAITQVALRQELADAKQEVNRLQETLKAIHTEKDQHVRGNMEKLARMEAELKATESFKGEFEKIRYERDELMARLEHMAGELKKITLKDQEIAALKLEIDELRQRHQQARMDFELQKKVSFERLEQKQAMEKNVFTMAREIEKLRAELGHVERRAQDVMLASSGGAAAPANSAPSIGPYENNYGAQQEAIKAGHSMNNVGGEAAKYGGAMQVSEDRMPRPVPSADSANEWSKHAAPNGRTFYYNAVTGATQWDKPSSLSANVVDTQAMHPRQQLQQQQGLQSAHDVNPEMANLQHQHHQQQLPPPPQQQQPPQQPISPAALPPQNTQIPAARQHANYGVNLFVLGVSEGISDRDLASLFLPYGRVSYAKVVAENKSGNVQCYGVITMETLQAAETAAAAVSGMLLLGRHIKVEIQQPRETVPQQQGYPQQPIPMQQPGMMPGGVAPVAAWQQRGGPAGRWPH